MSKPADEFSSRHSDSDESNHEDAVSDNEKPKQQQQIERDIPAGFADEVRYSLFAKRVQALSSLEGQALNNVERHAENAGIQTEKLENLRISIANGSPLWETLSLCIEVVDDQSQEQLASRLSQLARSGVGLNTSLSASDNPFGSSLVSSFRIISVLLFVSGSHSSVLDYTRQWITLVSGSHFGSSWESGLPRPDAPSCPPV
ncbi:ARM repeat superfamily protein [Artemisia annua]|uniref:ARM repeat superfamily protein n=1 Tax=Artemisia annua TaxID=35608 RepID=A0A2U1KH34_ARTAN|nr:ARM repeat superfamily protein [Artemisia annua]